MNALGFLFGLCLSVLAVAAAIWIVASGGSDRNALFMLLVSLLLFGWTIASAYSQQKTDRWLAQFPGPVVVSAPLWQRVFFCAVLILFGCLPTFGGAVISIRRGDWDLLQIVVVCLFGLCCAIGALYQLPRRVLVLSLDGLEYRSFRSRHYYRWSEFSNFHVVGGRWPHILCELADQASRHQFSPRSLLISGPLGSPKSMLKVLLISWQARALANASAQAAASQSAACDPYQRKGSLLDYA
ncbi:hypothetical protein [Mesorhizobium sp. B1-1-5]|uniref:hypothetical protein n=1 Tax=Mesorhizobium sp. B1-1-5 TaxID=2589979 RepID=UPI00112B1DC8|nr:hypothetical protein [Mesorhizobium sp. B1-1-5]TPO12099.1 hypothetical protein FJ980_04480 [Mesorhizobium sp. B1-1-5]